MKEITKLVTDKGDILLFVGTADGEEYYQKTDEKGGWSFMGLRPETEEALRERARDTDPADVLGMRRDDFQSIERWFDSDQFADDMEEDWEQNYDVQATREDSEGVTLYLGFGSGQDIDGYFKSNGITDYDSYCAHFDEIGLTEGQFNELPLKK